LASDPLLRRRLAVHDGLGLVDLDGPVADRHEQAKPRRAQPTKTAGPVDEVAGRQRLDLLGVHALAQRELQPQASWVAGGFLDELAARAAWTEQHRAVFE